MIFMWFCVAFVLGLLFLALFRPVLEYKIENTAALDPDAPEFFAQLEMLCDARVFPHNTIDVLTDGSSFYEAELEAIAGAKRSVHLEAYIFQTGEIADRFRAALTERARAGVEVKLIIDGVGSLSTPAGYFDDLKKAGGKVVFYHSVRWHTWDRYNNRTHREIVVVDGSIGFVGGAGVADHWYKAQGKARPWRDAMFRVRGEAVAGLESVFIENWAEAAGEILSFGTDLHMPEKAGATPAMVVGGTPSAGGSTRNRVLFQIFLASAQRTILITNPYFLPDASISGELLQAAQERGVEVKVITSGKKSDQSFTRSASRRLYGELLQGGVEIYEYEPAMSHTKTMTIDGLWSVVGTTNFDARSFGLNDEVNLVVRSEDLARRIEQDFRRDLANSRRIGYHEWKRRPVWERAHEALSGLLERQQ